MVYTYQGMSELDVKTEARACVTCAIRRIGIREQTRASANILLYLTNGII